MPLLLLTILSLSSMSSWAKEVGQVTHLSGILTVERAGDGAKLLSVQ
jgi:hypothetical protein